MSEPAKTTLQGLRQQFWSRVCYLKTISTSDLIRAHHHAQKNRISPEEALVDLGLLTRTQVREFLSNERDLVASA